MRGVFYLLDINEIQKIIPHRYPFLLVDRILEVEIGVKAIGIKNVSANEQYFIGHFPNYPVMPGVLIAEALAQVGAIAILMAEEYRGKLGFFAGIDNFRFRQQVFPGDTLRLETNINRMKGSIAKAYGIAKVGEKLVAEGELMFAIGHKQHQEGN